MKQLIIALQMQLLKKTNKVSIKPVLYRLFFTATILISAARIEANPIDSINTKYSRHNHISFFFTKTITDSVELPIGKIMGKILFSPDSIVAHINTPDIAQHLHFSADSTYSITESGKETITEKRTNIPPELNVLSMINPLNNITDYDSIYQDSHVIILYYGNNPGFSHISVFYNNEYRIDSVMISKGEKVINKTVYSEYREYFPQIIRTTDYLSGIVEHIFHYNIIIDKNNL